MIRINLLPHRALKRAARRRDFYVMAGASFSAAVLMVFAIGFIITGYITNQNQRNQYIKDANTKLDVQIKEIAQLRTEIEALKARQEAVENLQGDRNLPVHMLVELVKQVPEGIYLRSTVQEGMRIALNGHAQSNERIADLLRNLGNNSSWLERPQLLEIRLVNVGGKRLYEFGVIVFLKRPNEKDLKSAAAATAAKTAGAPAAGTAVPAPAATKVAADPASTAPAKK